VSKAILGRFRENQPCCLTDIQISKTGGLLFFAEKLEILIKLSKICRRNRLKRKEIREIKILGGLMFEDKKTITEKSVGIFFLNKNSQAFNSRKKGK